jgi:signal transduction histidine kinase
MTRSLYISVIVLLAGTMTFAVQLQWPAEWTVTAALLMGVIAVLVAVTLAVPLRISPDAVVSLALAPLFMGVLLLSPLQAVAAAVAGSLAADTYLQRRAMVKTLNAGVVGLAITLTSLFINTTTEMGVDKLLDPLTLGYAAVAGLILHMTNILVMAGLVSLNSGPSFLQTWWRTWLIETQQQSGSLILGYLGAALAQQRLWAIGLVVAPLILVHMALSRSVEEARRNIELAQQLDAQMKELRATQAQLIQQAKMASVGTLAAGVAHEVNNPLFAILGRAELLLQSPGAHLSSDRAKEYLDTIRSMAQRASTIVRELLAFSRQTAAPEPVVMQEMIDIAVDLVGKDLSRSGVNIDRVYQDIPAVQGYPNQLQQVFVNLFMNARDAMADGGSITTHCWSGDDYVGVSVKDTGCGIPLEQIPRLTEPFFTTKDVGQGTGLGLYVCHRIVTEHQGKITIESQVGVGTEVIIELPLSLERPETLAGASNVTK